MKSKPNSRKHKAEIQPLKKRSSLMKMTLLPDQGDDQYLLLSPDLLRVFI